MSKTEDALRLSLVSQRDSYKKQATYIEMTISSQDLKVSTAIKLNEQARMLRQAANDIDNLLYPID